MWPDRSDQKGHTFMVIFPESGNLFNFSTGLSPNLGLNTPLGLTILAPFLSLQLYIHL